jgi:hypothetical protein
MPTIYHLPPEAPSSIFPTPGVLGRAPPYLGALTAKGKSSTAFPELKTVPEVGISVLMLLKSQAWNMAAMAMFPGKDVIPCRHRG